MEKRLISLEERLVAALEKLATDELRRAQPTSSSTWWSFLLAVVVSTLLALVLCHLLGKRPAAQPMPMIFQGMPQTLTQTLPQGLPQGLPQLSAPPTPVLFAAPTSFLPRG